jgi:hypothetical protein
MADIQYSGMDSVQLSPGIMATVVNWVGAVSSVALVVGIGVWGYDLATRDAREVPVIKALEGPARVQPDEIGGEQAAHQGLAVNHIQAAGVAERPADRVILAPQPLDLNADMDVADPAEFLAEDTPEIAAEIDTEVAVAEPEDELPRMVIPLAPSMTAQQTGTAYIPASVPGVALSARPKARPKDAQVRLSALAAAPIATSAPAALDVAVAQVPAGTRLVQLGAYDSVEVAKAEWKRISAKFVGSFDGKRRFIQKIETGGKVFYRLRVVGFDDASQTRRFCALLVAEGAACIPVVAR